MSEDIVLGCGMAGIGAWYANNELEIFEAEKEAGGLCAGFEIAGFHFDKAVHLSFSKIDVVCKLFAQTRHYIHHPIPRSWYKNLWMKHPAQNNLYPLSADEKTRAIAGFIRRDATVEPDSFKSWNISKYGEYLWTHFFEPYNKKYWDVDLDVLGTDWIGSKIYQPSLEEILHGSYTDETPNTFYAPEMRYPQMGGYYAFIEPLVKKAGKIGKVHFGCRVCKIDEKERIVYFDNGGKCHYNKVYASIPLPRILEMINGMPEDLKRICLDYTGVAIVSIGLRRSLVDQMWFYIYDDDIMASRAYMPHVESEYNAPGRLKSIQFEIYFNSRKSAPQKEITVENCIYALKKMKIAFEEDILFIDFRILPYGNILLKKGDAEKINKILSWVESNGIYPIGRFGRWEYLWSDQSFFSGYNVVKKSINAAKYTR